MTKAEIKIARELTKMATEDQKANGIVYTPAEDKPIVRSARKIWYPVLASNGTGVWAYYLAKQDGSFAGRWG